MESKIQDRHKAIVCDICDKSMRSDHLKRHKQIQKDKKSNFITEYATIFKRNFWFYFGKIPGWDTLGPDMGMEIK